MKKKQLQALLKFHNDKRFCPCCGKRKIHVIAKVSSATVGEVIDRNGYFVRTAWVETDSLAHRETTYFCNSCGFSINTEDRAGEALEALIFDFFDNRFNLLSGSCQVAVESFSAMDEAEKCGQETCSLPIFWDSVNDAVTTKKTLSPITELLCATAPEQVSEIAEQFIKKNRQKKAV